MSELAIAAWKRRFPTRIVEVAKGEPELFSPGRRLGGGGIGVVHETTIDGIAVALKRTYTRRLTDQQWNEIKILGQISKQRHQHIVELIGSYVHRQRSGYELGLLIWPVAQTDLAAFLQDIDYLGNWIGHSNDNDDEDLETVLHNLTTLIGLDPVYLLPPFQPRIAFVGRYRRVLDYLSKTIGCTANAIAWLHKHGIRHKDIKPAQILLSTHGLWLTDFGWSKDVSNLANSATSGGEVITLKYHAPERAAKKRCGTAEDIFALGCVFLEIGTRLTRLDPLVHGIHHPWAAKLWSFHSNLEDIEIWTAPFRERSRGPNSVEALGRLIKTMMARGAEDRPGISKVVKVLKHVQVHEEYRTLIDDENHGDLKQLFYGSCCAPFPTVSNGELSKEPGASSADGILQHDKVGARSPNSTFMFDQYDDGRLFWKTSPNGSHTASYDKVTHQPSLPPPPPPPSFSFPSRPPPVRPTSERAQSRDPFIPSDLLKLMLKPPTAKRRSRKDDPEGAKVTQRSTDSSIKRSPQGYVYPGSSEPPKKNVASQFMEWAAGSQVKSSFTRKR
jgi:serine/threonine protein kinase